MSSLFDEEDLREWIERWYLSETEEEFQALVRLYQHTGIPLDEFKNRLQLLGYWSESMEVRLQPDTTKRLDLL